METVHNTFANFNQFFIDHGLVVRNWDKHKKTMAKDAGFHSASSTQEIEDCLTNKMAMTFKELAVVTEETINLVVGTKHTPPKHQMKNWPRPSPHSSRKWMISRRTRNHGTRVAAAMELPLAHPRRKPRRSAHINKDP